MIGPTVKDSSQSYFHSFWGAIKSAFLQTLFSIVYSGYFLCV